MNFLLMYTTDNILLVLLTKHLVHHDGEPTMPHKLATSMKLLLSNLRVLFCPWAVQKATAHDDIKALNMHHKSKKNCGIFVGIPQHQKGYLIYVPITRKIVFTWRYIWRNIFVLSYTPRPYSEALSMPPEVPYILYATSSHEQTRDFIAFAQFE